MAFPTAVAKRNITFGVPFGLADGENLIMRVQFTPTRSMVWAATGAPGIARLYEAKSQDGLQGSIPLPVTDQAGWLDGNGGALSVAGGAQTHAYAVKTYYETTTGKVVSDLPVYNIVVPTGDGSDLDLDLMLPISTVGGVIVSIPDLWSQQLAEAQEAAEALAGGAGGFLSGNYPSPGVNTSALDEAVAARIAAPSSSTRASLSASYSTLAQLAASPDQLAVGTITRSTTGAATGFSVVWPDGSTGTFAGTESSSFPGAVDAYTVTKVKSGVTVTFSQPAVTRDVNGGVTNRPAMTVA